MSRVKVLVGERVSLVVPEEKDIDLWYQGINDIENQQFLSIFGVIVSQSFEKEFFQNLNKDDKQLTFSIYIEELKTTIGNIGLFNIDYKNSRCELGIAVFDKNNQNKGYGSESIKLMQKYVFEVLGLNKLYLKYISNNPRAGHTYSKLGFREVGRMKQHEYRFGEYYDDVIMEIMREEYLSDKK